MVFAADVEKFLLEGIVFVPSLIVCAALTKPRFSWKISLSVLFGLVAAVVGIQAMLLAAGQDTTRVLTLLPLTAYLPAILCLHILSGTGFYRTMAVWTVGITVYFILDLLRKILVSEVGAGSPDRIPCVPFPWEAFSDLRVGESDELAVALFPGADDIPLVLLFFQFRH